MVMSPSPIATLIQNSALTWLWLISFRWIVASERPRSAKAWPRPVTVETMATKPKSAGVSSRASTIVATD